MPFSCLHVGSPLFAEQKFLGYRQWVLDNENAYAFLNGDLCEAAIIGSKGNPYEAIMTVSQAKLKIKELFTPLVKAKKIIGMCGGNHEERIYKATGNDISLDMAMFLNIEDIYDAQGLCGSVKVGGVTYSFYMKHGKGGGKKRSYKMRKMEEMGQVVKNCDLYIMAHIHDILTFQVEPIFYDTVTKKDIRIKQTYVSSSSYMDYGGYAEDFDFEPGKTGSPRIRLNGIKKDIHVSI